MTDTVSVIGGTKDLPKMVYCAELVKHMDTRLAYSN